MENNFKRFLALMLAVVMVIGMMPQITIDAKAEETTYVAKIGETGYETLAAAISAAVSMSGEVTIEIHGKANSTGISLNNANLTGLNFKGMTADAEICIDGLAYVDVRSTSYPVTYADLILSHTNGGYGNDGRLQEYFSTYNSGNVTYTNCSFPNGVTAMGCANGTTVTFKNCTFNNTTTKQYSLWVDGNGTKVIVEGGTFCGVRGVKLFAENGAAFSTLNVSGATFSDTITEKAAVVLTRGESVALTGNTYNNTTDKVQVDDDYASEIEGKSVTIEDTEYTVDSESTSLVEKAEETPAYVAEVNGAQYESLDDALSNANTGDTIVLLADATFSGQNAADKLSGYVIDLNDKTVTLSGNTYLTGETTIKNGKIVVSGSVSDSYLCLYTADTKLTLDDVSLTGTMDCYAVLNGATGSTLIIKNSTIDVVGNVTNPDAMGNIIYGGNVTVDNSTIKGDNTVRGIGFSNITIQNGSTVEISNVETGLNCATVTVDNSTVIITNATKRAVRLNNNALTLQNGATLTATDCTADIIGIGTTDTVSVSSDSTLNAVDNVTPAPAYVAQIGTKGYETLQAAIDAVQNGETIELLGDVTEELVTIEKASGVAFTIDGKNNKFTGEFEIGIGESITIQNINFVASAEISPEYFIDSMDKNSNCVLTIQNCTFTDTDYSTTAIGTHQPTKVVIDGCTANGVASLLQNQGGYDITVKNTSIEGKRGISLGTVVGATVENVTIKAADDKYGIRLNGEIANNTITIKDCDIQAFIPVVVRKAQVENYSVIFEGTNTMTAQNTDGLWMAIGATEYEKNGEMPTDPTGKVTVTLNDPGLNADGVYGNYVEPPKGSINGGLVNMQNANRTFLTIESYITYANESIVVKVFDANGTLLATSSLVDNDRVILGKENWGGLSTMVGINCTDEWWNTVWEADKLRADYVPAKATLYIDGVEMNTAVVQMRAAGSETTVNWAEVPGVPGVPVAMIGDVKYETLAEAVAAAESGATIILMNGEHELPAFSGKELTFKGESKDGVIVNDAPDARTQGWVGSSIHFENLTAKGATANYHGLANGVVAVTYKDCNVNGLRFLYATDVSFEGCAFNAEGVEHSFWTYGASNITVTNCTFTYTDRAVNCYSENGADHETDIAFTGCTFTYAGTAESPEGAVEINSGSSRSIDLTMNDCTAPAKGAMWFNSQWDSTGGAKTTVKVDNKQVWPLVYVAQIDDVKYESLQDAENAAKDGDTIVLLENIELDGMVTFFNSASARMVTLDMNGKTITLADNWDNSTAKSAFWVCDGLTITGNGTINAAPDGDVWAYTFIVGHRTAGTTDGYVGNLVIENGTFSSDDSSVVSVTNGTATINGGTFEAAGDMDLNCIDDMRAAGKASIVVKGGTFVGFNPQNNASEGANTNFCAEGYAALPDLNGNYVVGAKPTATVNDLGMTTVAAGDYMVYGNGDNTADMPLSFVMQFLADQKAEDMATSPFADWYGDFVITFTGIENGSFTADGCYLAGHYGSFGWVKVPVDGMTIEEGARYPVMLGVGMGQKYDYICSSVQDFKCALYLTPEILAANPNIQVKLELAVVDNSQGSDAAASALINNENVYSVTDYTYDAEDFAVKTYVAQIGETKYQTLQAAIDAATAGQTITLLADITEDVTVGKSLTIDGAGKTYTGTMTVGGGIALTVKNFNFDGANSSPYPIKVNKGNSSIVVEDCTVKDYQYSFLYVRTTTKSVSVKNVTVENCPSYAVYFASGVTDATFENLTVKNSNNGFIINNTADRAFTIKNCKMENVGTAIAESKGTNTITCTALGVNDFGTAAISQYANIAGATIEGTNLYGSVASMVAKAENGQTVTVTADHELVWDGETTIDGLPVIVAVDGKTVTIDLNGKKLTGTSGDENLALYAAFAVDNDGSLTLKDSVGTASVEITGTSTMYSLLMAYEYGANKTTKLIVEGGSYYLENAHDCLIFCGQEVKDIVYIKGGTFELGNVGTGENGKPWIFNVVGAGGGCANITGGTFNADINNQFWSSEAVVDETCYVVNNGNGTWTVNAGAAAYVQTTKLTGPYDYQKNIGYATLEEAIAAAVQYNDPNVTLLKDITISETLVINGNVNINGNGKTITYTGTDRIMDVAAADVVLTLKDLNLVSSASYCQRGISIGNNVDLTLDNVSVKGTNVTYALNLAGASNNAKVTITDSDLTGCIALNVWGKNVVVNANNSEFTSVDKATQENYAAIVLNNNGSVSAENTVINVTGGKITALDENNDPSIAIRNATATGTVNVSDTTVVTGEISEVVAIVTYNGYDEFYSYLTLQAAINSATNDPTATVKLLKDITISEKLVIEGNVTIDGNGKTLTYTGTDRAIEIPMEANGADVTIKNLTVDASSAERGINYNTNGTLTVENVTVTSTTYAINFPTYADNATVSIKDSKLTSAIALNIWGSDMTITVTDSELYSVENDPNFSYATIQLNRDDANGHIAERTTVTVNGGKLSAIDENGDTSIAVSNWTETGEVTISSTTEVNGEIKYAVATYGGASAYTLQDAVDEVIRMGYTCPIVLIRDIALTENVIIPANANITIDLNGKTLTGPDDGRANWYAFIVNGGKLTLTDSEGTGELFAKCYGVETKSGEFILDGAMITATNNATLGSAIVNYGGTVTIKSGTISGALSSVFTGGYFSNATTNILGGEFAGDVIVESYADKDFTETVTSNANTYPVGEDYKWVEQNGVYVLTAKTYVAQLGETKYETFAEALNAVQDGETITVLDVASEAELKKEIEFTKDIEFTITGTAPNYALPVVTFQNATVNIKDAEILIPELDARQNATINVINSTVHDAGGNGIVKSYYNGAINISGTSVVYTMQVTTMGYITISDTAQLNATWQTNVYGNGMIVVEDGATFATAALHLTGKDYSGRDNTDADRVGQPATIVVDGATFIVGKVYSDNGADYSYNSSKGINIGTIAGKSAVLDIKNGANVEVYMANGETANIGADGTVNVDASSFTVACRAADGKVTVANNGTILVSGASDIAANVTGEGWVYMNCVTLDADTKLHGAKVGFINGTNNIVGSTIDGGWFSVGIGQNAAAETAAAFAEANGITLGDVTVNVSGDAIIGSSGDAAYTGWIGSAYSADKTQHKYVLNVENSLATFGYLHISKDGELNVKGHATNKYTTDGSNVDFYAGNFIVNGVATLDGTDAWVRWISLSVDHAGGIVNVTNGTKLEASRHIGSNTGYALKFFKAGEFNVDATSAVEIDNEVRMIEDGKVNIAGKVTVKGAVTGNGTISLTDAAATLTAAEGLTVTTTVADHEVKYEDGVYKVVEKQAEAIHININTDNMTLGNSLAINFWVYKNQMREGVEYTAKLVRTYADGTTETLMVPMSDWVEYGTYYQVVYDKFAAKEMTDTVSIEILMPDGASASNVFVDSIKEYAMFMLSVTNDAELHTVLVDMLNYGTAAQKQFNYKTDDLANVELTAEQQAKATKEVNPENHWSGSGLAYSSNLELVDNIILRLWFTNVTEDMYAVVKFTNHYGESIETIVDYDEFFKHNDASKTYSVPVDELVIADAGQIVTCELYNGNGELVGTITESIESYLLFMMGADPENKDMYEAVMKFVTSAYNVFH